MDKLKKVLGGLRPALSITVILMLLCGFAYPLLMTGLSQLLFPHQAGGSLVDVEGKAVGARYVGQEFSKAYFMKGRPSAVHYNTYVEEEDGEKRCLDGSEFCCL